MASFDILDAAGFGYRFIWRERTYLQKLALGPALIDLACLAAITWFGWDTRFVRQAIVLLPAMLAQGWMAAHVVRLIFLKQRWPFHPSGNVPDDRAALNDRMHGIIAGALCFALARFLLTGLTAGLYHFDLKVEANPAAVPPWAAVAAIGVMVLVFWGIRLLWLFIPAALRHPLRPTLIGVRGMMTSLCLFGVILIGFMPPVILSQILLAVIAAGAPVKAKGAVAVADVVLRVAADILVTLITTASVSQAFHQVLGKQKVSV